MNTNTLDKKNNTLIKVSAEKLDYILERLNSAEMQVWDLQSYIEEAMQDLSDILISESPKVK